MSVKGPTAITRFHSLRAAPVAGMLALLVLAGCNPDVYPTLERVGSVTLTWTQPTERVNSDHLTDDDISGYIIRYRRSSNAPYQRVFVDNCNSNSCSHTIDNLRSPSSLTFHVAAVDSVGLRSAFVTAED